MSKGLRILLILLAVAGVFYFFVWDKPHKDMGSARSDSAISANALYQAFDSDETTAQSQYLDKVVEVTGKIRSYEMNTEVQKVILETGDILGGVACELDDLVAPKRTSFQVGEQVTFKGLCTGKLLDVVLVRCVEL
ncbi:MAG: hypothetical protein HKN16_12315 [Saprospiraceae bacterium]|nr:hypothetical protein [Saprospiraceae bacterium]